MPHTTSIDLIHNDLIPDEVVKPIVKITKSYIIKKPFKPQSECYEKQTMIVPISGGKDMVFHYSDRNGSNLTCLNKCGLPKEVIDRVGSSLYGMEPNRII